MSAQPQKINFFDVYCSSCGKHTEVKTYSDPPNVHEIASCLGGGWHGNGYKLYCSFDCWAKELISGLCLNINHNPQTCKNKLEALKRVINEHLKMANAKTLERKALSSLCEK